MNEIIININEANKAQKYNEKGIFQIDPIGPGITYSYE